mmetsp:Transcript_727/g.1682  ORF Transcript_727/g.1682 Transcript_727/m.1682 type:complete len:202 (+) Transcript_727:405-1010(+)
MQRGGTTTSRQEAHRPRSGGGGGGGGGRDSRWCSTGPRVVDHVQEFGDPFVAGCTTHVSMFIIIVVLIIVGMSSLLILLQLHALKALPDLGFAYHHAGTREDFFKVRRTGAIFFALEQGCNLVDLLGTLEEEPFIVFEQETDHHSRHSLHPWSLGLFAVSQQDRAHDHCQSYTVHPRLLLVLSYEVKTGKESGHNSTVGGR